MKEENAYQESFGNNQGTQQFNPDLNNLNYSNSENSINPPPSKTDSDPYFSSKVKFEDSNQTKSKIQ